MHIAMVACTTPSHVYPSLAVIRELVRRGHRVTYVIGDRLAPLVEPTGAEVIPFETTLPPEDGDWPNDPASEVTTGVFFQEAKAMLPLLVDRYRWDRPDLVLYDTGGQAGRLLARRHGVPAVLLAHTWVLWDGFEKEHAESLEAMRTTPAGLAYHAAFSSWLEENGIEQDPWEWIGDMRDIVALIPRILQPNADRVSPAVRFAGPCLDHERLAAGGWVPPPSGRRVLLVSLGTLFNDRLDILRLCVDAFSGDDSGWHVVMAVGTRVDPAALGPLPPWIEVHRSVPQLPVLASASAFVTHAGMGSSAESLWFGVPTVAIPQAAEQFGNAAMLQALGAGQQLLADGLDAERLHAAVEHVAGAPQIALRLKEIQAAVRAEAGAGHAADAIESFLP